MQSFLGRLLISPSFDLQSPTTLVSCEIGLLSYSRLGQRFVQVLTASYEGRSLTTDIEVEVGSLIKRTSSIHHRIGLDFCMASDWSHWTGQFTVCAIPPLRRSLPSLLENEVENKRVLRKYIQLLLRFLSTITVDYGLVFQIVFSLHYGCIYQRSYSKLFSRARYYITTLRC